MLLRARFQPVLLAGLLAAAACSACGGSAPPARAASAVLVTLDTTRADALSCLGFVAGTTPHLDALASEGQLYVHARTSCPITLPAHASMLTGLFPLRHGVRVNGANPLPASAVTVAERAREGGRATAAFLAAVVLDASFGLDQGFDVYDVPAPELSSQTTHYAERPASEVIDAALAWLAARDSEQPFFLWVHLFDPHQPYRAPERFARAVPNGNPYLAEVAYMDDQIGRLLDTLRAEGALEYTTVVVAGDHGEGLGEHGEATHAAFCWDTTLRVPLIVRPSNAASKGPGGQRLEACTSVVDVGPTLVAALGLPPLADTDGLSLLDGAPPVDRGVYFESYYGYLSYGWSPLVGWVDPGGKYLHSSAPELYDWRTDHAEARDVLPARAHTAEAYRQAIQRLGAAPRLERAEAVRDGDLAQGLSALGYAGADERATDLPEPLANSTRPAPHARAQEQLDLQRAMAMATSGDVPGALTILERIVATNPDHFEAVEHRTSCLMSMGRHAEAIAALLRVVAQAPGRANAQAMLGLCLRQVGRTREAEAALMAALEIQPSHVDAMLALAGLLYRAGRDAEGDRVTERLQEQLGPRFDEMLERAGGGQ